MKTEKKHTIIYIIIAGIITEIFYLSFLFFSNNTQDIPLYIFIYFETTLIMFISLYFINKILEKKTKRKEDNIKKKNFLLAFLNKIIGLKLENTNNLVIPLLLIFFGLLFRFSLSTAQPTTSQDVYRYLWEGKVIANGYNPFIQAPNDSSLIHLRDDVYEKVTFKDISAIYPPLSQLIFTISNKLNGEGIEGLKMIYLIFEFFTMIFILKLLQLKKKRLSKIILYAWLPLSIMEYFINAHLDPIGILFMVMFIFYSEKENYVASAITFSFAVMAKLYPIILFPLILKKFGQKRSLVFTAIFTVILFAFYFPFINFNLSVFSALKNYLANWEFNGSVFNLLKLVIADTQLIRLICAILFISSVGFISYKFKDFTNAAIYIFLCLIVFSTTLYPWYLGWIAALNPVNVLYSVTSLLFTNNFSNFTPLGTEWKEYFVVLLIQYVPFFIFLFYDLYLIRKKEIEHV